VRALLIANIAIFVILRMPGVDEIALRSGFGMVPADVFRQGRIWQLVTYMFLHGSFLHILFNMLMLWMFGTTIEHQWGSRDFLSYYTVCGVGGAIAHWISGPSSLIPVIGASGAVFGLLVAYALMYPDREVLLWFVIRMRMKVLIWGFVALSLVLALTQRAGGIAHYAHLGGALFGWLYLKMDWRLGAVGRRVRAARARRVMQQNVEKEQSRQASMEQVDAILDKINEHGYESLSEQERRILREASKH
jgi:membrane associated rhomboid family serine protease